MKTLDDRADDYMRSIGLRYGAVWEPPFRDTFMAGAAAMAEIFASGQALKIEQTPKKYLVSCEIGGYGGYVSHTLTFAFNSREAIEQAGFFGQVPCSGLKVRPATEEDEKLEGVVHV